MVRINLASAQNKIIRCCLDSADYTIAEFNPEPADGILGACRDLPGSYTLLQIVTGSRGISNCSPEVLAALAASTHLVCLADELTDPARATLLSAGVCDCLCSTSPHIPASYLEAIIKTASVNNGTFAVLDRNSVHVRMLSGIAGRFGYSIRQLQSIEEFYSFISVNVPAMTLINLGTDIDFNRFIRESHSSPIKKSPVIAYKDLNEGLFVHEVLNGLGKITRLILSLEELYRLLIDLLMNKGIISGASRFNHSIEYEKHKHYRGMTLQQMYYEIHNDPCGQESLISRNRAGTIMNELEEIRRCLLMGEGIKWLAGPCSGKATCGAGA